MLINLGIAPPSAHASDLSVDDLKTIATAEAAAHNLDTTRFLKVIDCESHWDATTVGDGGRSFGLVQIFLPAHPEITKAQALDAYWALNWAAEQWALHHEAMWSCFKLTSNTVLK